MLALSRSYFKSYSGLPMRCWVGIGVYFMESTLMGVFYFLSIYFTDELKFSVASSGMIISAYGIGAVLGGYLGGWLSDNRSPIFVITCSLLVQGVGYLTLIEIESIYLLVANIFVLGIASYGFITASQLWVLDQAGNGEADKIKVLNILSVASNLGLAISGIVIGMVISIGFHHVFFVVGILFLSLALLVLKANGNYNAHIAEVISTDEIQSQRILSGGMLMVLISVLFVGIIVAQLSSTYPIYIREAFPDLGINAVSILFALNSLIVVAVATPLGRFVSNYNKYLMLGIGGCAIGVGMMLLCFSKFFLLAAISCIIYSVGEIIFFCMAQFLCYESGASGKKGRGLGIYRVVYATSRIIGPVVGSIAYDQFGGNMIWYASGVIGMICLITTSVYIMRRYHETSLAIG